MGSPDGTKIALGLLASTSALILSYIFLKKFGFRARQNKLEESEHEFQEHCAEEPNVTTYEYEDKEAQGPAHAESQEKGEALNTFDNECGDDGQNQTSFIVLDDAPRVAPPEGASVVKKSDKSSDESSYDVIEDDRMAEMEEDDRMAEMEEDEDEKEEGGNENASAKEPSIEKSAGDRLELESSLETSMVVVEEAERSQIEKSGSSFYTSADEHFGAAYLEDNSKKDTEKPEEDKSDQRVIDLSTTEDETTVMYKSTSAGNESATLEGKDSAYDVTPVVEEFIVAGGEESENTAGEKHIDDPVVQARLDSHAVTDAVLRADLEAAPVAAAPASQGPPPPHAERELNLTEVTEVLSKCQSMPMTVTKEDIDLLVHLLRKNMPELQATVLNSIVRIAAFNQNTNNIRESGCPEEIVYQLKTNCEAVVSGETGAEVLLTSICQVLTNLSMDPKAHPKLEEGIPSLINLLVLDAPPESLILTTLRPLINLSGEPTYHAYYVRAIPMLMKQQDEGSDMAKVQSLKVLINLSLDEEMVPHLLAAKAPLCLKDHLETPTPNDVILRTVTMLANIFNTMSEKKISQEALPTGYKTDLSGSMFVVLNDPDYKPTLRGTVLGLTRHEDGDISLQASRLYKHFDV